MSLEIDEQEWINDAIEIADMIQSRTNHYQPEADGEMYSTLQELRKNCLDTLRSIPQGCRESVYARSMHCYLIGKCLDSNSPYNQEAEDQLSRAVELNPQLLDAWRCLGICAMKRDDFLTAKEQFNHALRIDVQDKRTLCDLSLMEILQYFDSNKEEHVDRSLHYAREAVNVDNNDGYCLYTLGRAHMTCFNKGGQRDHEQVQHALNAFEKAKGDSKMGTCPYLLYQSAVANTFLQNYERALADYERCLLVYPTSDHPHQLKMLIQLLNNLNKLLQEKRTTFSHVMHCYSSGFSKEKGSKETSGASLHHPLTRTIPDIPYVLVPSSKISLDILSQGSNRGIALDGKVLHLVKKKFAYPLYCVVSDLNKKRFIVTVHGVYKTAIKKGDQVTLLEPFCKFIDFKWEEKHYKFKSVQVNSLDQIHVNGRQLAHYF